MEQLFQLREQVDLHFGKPNQRRIREIIVEATLAIEEFRSTQNRVSAAANREPFECFIALKRLTPEKIAKIKEKLRKAHRKKQQQNKRLLPGRNARDQVRGKRMHCSLAFELFHTRTRFSFSPVILITNHYLSHCTMSTV